MESWDQSSRAALVRRAEELARGAPGEGAARLDTVRGIIDRLIADGTVTARSDGSVRHLFPTAVPGTEGQALREWIIAEKAAHTIEIGLGYAVSALFICEGLLTNAAADARHIVIDPNQERGFANCGLQLLDEAGVAEMVEHHAEPSQVVLPRFLAEGRTFDLAFVDGNHRFDFVFLDLVYLGCLLRPGSIVFVDDYHLPAIARAVSFFLTNRDWTMEDVSAPDDVHQWVVIRTSGAPDDRRFDHYVDF